MSGLLSTYVAWSRAQSRSVSSESPSSVVARRPGTVYDETARSWSCASAFVGDRYSTEAVRRCGDAACAMLHVGKAGSRYPRDLPDGVTVATTTCFPPYPPPARA